MLEHPLEEELLELYLASKDMVKDLIYNYYYSDAKLDTTIHFFSSGLDNGVSYSKGILLDDEVAQYVQEQIDTYCNE